MAIGTLIKKQYNKFDKLSTPVKASVAFMICSFMQRGISTLTTPIFTRLLDTEQYGYYTIFTSWLEIISVFTTLKLAGSVFTQALVKFDKERETLAASTAGLGTTVTLFVTCIYLPLRKYINSWLGMPTLIVLCMFIASWAVLMFELWAAQQRVEYKYKALVLLTLLTSIAKPVSGIIAVIATKEYKAEARIVSLVIVELLAYTGLFVSFLRKGKTFYNKRFWKYSLSLNIPLIPHYLTRTILHQADRLMIKHMVSYSAAGIYGLAYNLAWMLTLVTNAILNTLNPWIFERIKKKEYKRIGSLSYMILGIVAVTGLALIALAPEAVRIFAPAKYHGAIWIIPPVTASVYFLFMYSLFADFEFYFEKSGFMTIASTIGGVLNIILNYIFINLFGYIAAGYTTLFCYFFYAAAHYICMRRIIKKQLDNVKVYDLKIIIAISAVFLGLSALLMVTYNYPVIRYCIILASMIAVIIKRDFFLNTIKEIKKK